jgi:hypothetical protein
LPLLRLLLRFLLGLLLWPVAGCLAFALAAMLSHLPWQDMRLLAFAGGVLAYLGVQVFLSKPLFLYVLGHELTHALAAWLQGGRADDLQVSGSKGGSVKVNRNNALVSLAPYVFPLYTFMVLGVVLAFDPNPNRLPLVLFLYGFTLAFHAALTIHSLSERQSDLEDLGWFLALPVIVSVNALVVALIVAISLPEAPGFWAFLSQSGSVMLRFALWARGLF